MLHGYRQMMALVKTSAQHSINMFPSNEISKLFVMKLFSQQEIHSNAHWIQQNSRILSGKLWRPHLIVNYSLWQLDFWNTFIDCSALGNLKINIWHEFYWINQLFLVINPLSSISIYWNGKMCNLKMNTCHKNFLMSSMSYPFSVLSQILKICHAIFQVSFNCNV